MNVEDSFPFKFWKKVVDNSLTGIHICDSDLILVYVNRIVETATGYSKEELIGNKVSILVAEEEKEEQIKIFSKVFEGETVSYESRYRRKDGEVRWVKGFAIPVKHDGGIYALGNWIDITRQKELEEKLKEDSELFRALVHDSPTPAYVISGNKFIYANKALQNLVGCSWDELKEMDPLQFIYPEDREMVEERYRERLAGKRKIETYSWRIMSRDGSIHWVAARPSRLIFEGHPAVASILIDTSDIHLLAEELKKSGEYLALINKILRHDILNDLTVIRGYIEIGGDELREIALSKIDRIQTLIKESKAIEEAIGSKQSVNLAEIVREVGKYYENQADVEYVLNDVFVEANQALYSVVDNLMRNAVMHSKKDRVKITIEVFSSGRFGVMRIKDDGVGIPDSLKEMVFEEGFSTSNSTGLGLYIVKKVIELLHGEIEVYDNEPTGAVFEIKIRKKQTSS